MPELDQLGMPSSCAVSSRAEVLLSSVWSSKDTVTTLIPLNSDLIHIQIADRY